MCLPLLLFNQSKNLSPLFLCTNYASYMTLCPKDNSQFYYVIQVASNAIWVTKFTWGTLSTMKDLVLKNIAVCNVHLERFFFVQISIHLSCAKFPVSLYTSIRNSETYIQILLSFYLKAPDLHWMHCPKTNEHISEVKSKAGTCKSRSKEIHNFSEDK